MLLSRSGLSLAGRLVCEKEYTKSTSQNSDGG